MFCFALQKFQRLPISFGIFVANVQVIPAWFPEIWKRMKRLLWPCGGMEKVEWISQIMAWCLRTPVVHCGFIKELLAEATNKRFNLPPPLRCKHQKSSPIFTLSEKLLFSLSSNQQLTFRWLSQWKLLVRKAAEPVCSTPLLSEKGEREISGFKPGEISGISLN